MPRYKSPFEFNPKLCCAHKWQEIAVAKDAADTTTQHSCSVCKATCVRDKEGLIIEYDRTGGKPEQASNGSRQDNHVVG